MADSTLLNLDSGTPLAAAADADAMYIEDDTDSKAKHVLLSVVKTYVSDTPTLVTPVLGTPSAGDISACTSTDMALTTPDLGVPSAIDITAATGTVTSLTLVTPLLGTVTSGDISACTSTDLALTTPDLGVPSAVTLTNADGGVVDDLASAIAGNSVAITSTVDGTGTGLIPATAEHVSITSSVGTKQVSLPAAVAGKRIRVTGPTNGVELISVVAGDKVNTIVVGATNEAALIAGSLYTLEYDGTDNWIMTGTDALGAVETPVVPDILD